MKSLFENVSPVTLTEAIRQVILALVLFEVVNWTDPQIAGLLMAVSAVLALVVRSSTVSTATMDKRHHSSHPDDMRGTPPLA